MEPDAVVPLVDPVREMYTYDQFAALMQVTKDTLYRWVRLGMIPSPTYIPSARFTAETVALVQRQGSSPPGTYMRTVSDRSQVGRLGAEAKQSKRKKKVKHKTTVVKKVHPVTAAYAASRKGGRK